MPLIPDQPRVSVIKLFCSKRIEETEKKLTKPLNLNPRQVNFI